MQAFLEQRAAELEDRVRERDLDLEQVRAHLPEDPPARVAALATVLGIDALGALREGTTIEQLEQEAEARRLLAAQVTREAEESGISPPAAGEEGDGT